MWKIGKIGFRQDLIIKRFHRITKEKKKINQRYLIEKKGSPPPPSPSLVKKSFISGSVLPNLLPEPDPMRESQHLFLNQPLAGTAAEIIYWNNVENENSLTLRTITLLNQWIIKYQKRKTQTFHSIIRSASSEIFCRGYDLKTLYDDPSIGPLYFQELYQLVTTLATAKKPVIIFLDGSTASGGSFALHSGFRVATENSVFSLPDIYFGFFPVGGMSYFLSRLPNSFGMFLALTGESVKGSDLLHTEIANIYSPSDSLDLFADVFSKLHSLEPDKIELALEQVSDNPGEFTLDEHIDQIKVTFSAKSLTEILDRLQFHKSPWFRKLGKRIKKASPICMKIAFQLITSAKHKTFSECLQMEYNAAIEFLKHPDFKEGKKLVYKKTQRPKWLHKNLESVTDQDLKPYFPEKSPQQLELSPLSIGFPAHKLIEQFTIEQSFSSLKDDLIGLIKKGISLSNLIKEHQSFLVDPNFHSEIFTFEQHTQLRKWILFQQNREERYNIKQQMLMADIVEDIKPFWTTFRELFKFESSPDGGLSDDKRFIEHMKNQFKTRPSNFLSREELEDEEYLEPHNEIMERFFNSPDYPEDN